MKVSHKWLQTYFDQSIPSPSELVDLFTFHSCEVEGTEEIKNTDGSYADTVFDLKVLPDRAHYALSHQGIAEEISAITGMNIKQSHVRRNRSAQGTVEETHTDKVLGTVTDESFCPRFTSRLVKHVSVEESPEWLKQYLTSVGSRSINTIVDATNFTMLDSGQPLHAFDADKIKGNIVVRAAEAGEKLTTLDGKEVTLTVEDHVLADDIGALDVAGVKGGARAAVTNDTKNIVLTVCNFAATAVRRSSIRVGIRNESSKRYENEISPELALNGMHQVSALIKDLSPHASFGPIVDVYPTPVKDYRVAVSPSRIASLLGAPLSEDEMENYLKRQNISVEKFGDDEWHVTVPHYRIDVQIEADVADEIGRLHGYRDLKDQETKNVPGIIEIPAYVGEGISIKNALVQSGFQETYLYTFRPKGDIEVAYPQASDKSYLRTNLSDGLLEALERNTKNADLLGLESVNIFEIGNVFTEKGEYWSLAIASQRIKKVKGVTAETEIMRAVELVKEKTGLDVLTLGKIVVSGNVAHVEVSLKEYFVEKQKQGNPEWLDRVRAITPDTNPVRFTEFSLYPYIVRDIALFVPESEDEQKVLQDIKSIAADSKLLQDIRLFDVFVKKLENGEVKKSIAYRLIFQSMERTLTDEEINTVMEKVYEAMREKGFEVR